MTGNRNGHPPRPVAREVPFIDPVSAFAPFAEHPFAIFLDSAEAGGERGRFSYIALRPIQVVTWQDETQDPFKLLRAAYDAVTITCDPALPPFQGGICGVLGYELGRSIERLPPPKSSAMFPDLVFGVFDTVISFDIKQRRAWVVAVDLPGSNATAEKRTEDVIATLERIAELDELPPAPESDWIWDLGQAEFVSAVRRAVDYIYAGDIFQANITTRARAVSSEDAFTIYRRLRSISPAPFAAFVRVGADRALISASPERFLSVSADGHISTRPIKGTRPRADTPEEDAVNAVELTESIKDRAENLMIVDLLRNDISRVATIGSVNVTALFELETFANVHHLVSEVTGQLRADCNAIDLLRAAFPGGSITGAPKVRAMEIIHEIETSRRGPYCGSVFWIGGDGAMDSSIVIRSLIASGEHIYAHAGGGIVADSDPEGEYEEMHLKMSALLRSVAGEG